MGHNAQISRLMAERKEDGFTLIELLVVIAVVSVLVAILLPALHRVRVVSQRVRCQANLRQIAQAWQMYLDDNNGRFYQGLNADMTFAGWCGLRDPESPRPLNWYLGLAELPETESQALVAKCPVDTGHESPAGLSVYAMNGASYRTNLLVIGPDQIPPLLDPNLTDAINRRLPGLRVQATSGHARLLLVGDCGWVDQWWPTSDKTPEGWHGRSHYFSLAFMDGHTGFLQIRKGMCITDEYTVIPFADLYGPARAAQPK
jgi:prepilin-type N-terminal cleavage/methylation domain-containing protein